MAGHVTWFWVLSVAAVSTAPSTGCLRNCGSRLSVLSPVSTNLPVMVYLFGGAFMLGASNDLAILGDSLYDGKEMADRGGVIVVTVNYRVGTMGFLSTGDSRLPGQNSPELLI